MEPIYIASATHQVDSEFVERDARWVEPRYVAAVARRARRFGFWAQQNQHNSAVEMGFLKNHDCWSLAFTPDEDFQPVYDFRAGDPIGVVAEGGSFVVDYVTSNRSLVVTTSGLIIPVELVAHVVE